MFRNANVFVRVKFGSFTPLTRNNLAADAMTVPMPTIQVSIRLQIKKIQAAMK